MKSISISSVVILLLVSIAALAQKPENLFGSAVSNGYLDPGLPAPLTFPSGKTPAMAADRVSELTVTVTIAVVSLLRRSGS